MTEPTEVFDTTTDVPNHIEAPVSDQDEGAYGDEATERNEAMPADLLEGHSATPPGTDGTKARLGASQLRDMVLVHLREHSDQDHTPSAIGKVLARSSGAIANACEKLATEGAIALTSQRRRKYRFVDRAWPTRRSRTAPRWMRGAGGTAHARASASGPR